MQHWSDYLASLVIASARKVEIDAACEHPRIALLRREAVSLKASDEQKLSLLQSVEVFREKFTSGQAVHLWCHHRDGSKTYDKVNDLEWLINHLPGMAGEIALYQVGNRSQQPRPCP